MRYVIFVFFLFYGIYVEAQFYNQTTSFLNYNKTWAWGKKAGYNFGSQSPFISSSNSLEGSASVSDPQTGQLLFYFAAGTCWNQNHQAMSQGINLLGNVNVPFFPDASGTTAQGNCIVPFINDSSKFYLFSLEAQGGYNTNGSSGRLYYSIVDMNLNGGLGNVVASQKNILLDTYLGEAMIAIPGNNCDIWLLVHPTDTFLFKAYHITSAGIAPNPVISAAGQQLSGYNMVSGGFYSGKMGAYMRSCLAVSPNREKIAITSNTYDPFVSITASQGWVNGSMVCDFDPNTGMVSNGQMLDSLGCYGVAFSPDNTKLYVTTTHFPPASLFLYQYDITNFNAQAILASRQLIYNIPGTPGFNANGLKLYNDTIYMASCGGAFVDRINNPDLQGAACNFQPNALQLLPNTVCQIGLPNEVVAALPPDTVGSLLLDTLICNDWPDSMLLQAPAGFSSYLWDNGSTAAVRAINGEGTYSVFCFDQCHSKIDTFRIRYADDRFDLGHDTVVCNSRSFLLNADIDDAQYLWQDGSTEQSYQALATGTYRVSVYKGGCSFTDSIFLEFIRINPALGSDTVFCIGEPFSLTLYAHAPEGSDIRWNTGATNSSIAVKDTGIYKVVVTNEGCSGTDEVVVGQQYCDCPYLVPNAFSPNNDGVNDIFRLQWPQQCMIQSYVLRIFDRWGQQIFTSIESGKGWDGTLNGKPADVGTYYYEVDFNTGTRRVPQRRKGDITLIR